MENGPKKKKKLRETEKWMTIVFKFLLYICYHSYFRPFLTKEQQQQELFASVPPYPLSEQFITHYHQHQHKRVFFLFFIVISYNIH